MPAIDKIVLPFVVLSVLLIVFEALNWWFGGRDYPTFQLITSAIFLMVFVPEFLVRSYLRGTTYLRTWGWIDLLVILADWATVVLFVIVTFFDHGETPWVLVFTKILRLLRLFRLLRITKLIRYFGQRRHIVRYVRRLLPYPLAVLLSFGWIAVAAILLLFAASAIFQLSPVQLVEYLLNELQSVLSVSEGQLGQSDPTVKLMVQLTALFIAAMIFNIFGLVFVPILDRLKLRRTEIESESLLANHVVIVLNEYDAFEGSLEEFLRVFREYAGRDVIVLMERERHHKEEEQSHPQIRFLKGSLSSPGLWAQAHPDRADAVVVLGTGDIDPLDYPVLVRTPEQTRLKPIPIFIVKDEEGQPARRNGLGAGLCDLIEVPFGTMDKRMHDNSWDQSSLQYALFERLISQLDPRVGFPILRSPGDDQQVAAEIERALLVEADGRFSVDRNGQNVKISVEDVGVLEANEIHMIQALSQVLLDFSSRADAVNFFVYVETLQLLAWNDVFAEDGFDNVTVFAIELSTPLAIFHEMEFEGALDAWFAEPGELDEVAVPSLRKQSWFSMARLRQILPEEYRNQDVLAIASAPGGGRKHKVFLDRTSHRLQVQAGDVAVMGPRPSGN